MIRVLLFIFSLCLSNGGLANQATMTQAKAKLKALENKMSVLFNSLKLEQSKRDKLEAKLVLINKNIQEGHKELNVLQAIVNQKQQQINELKAQIDVLSQKLSTQQQLLAAHVRSRYQLGEYQPIQGLINQDNQQKITQLLTLHQYLVHSRVHLMDDIKHTQQSLFVHKAHLQQEVLEQERVQEKVNQRQRELAEDKTQQLRLIQALNKNIQDKQKTLTIYQKDRENLSTLLLNLTKQSVIQSRHSLNQMHHKLPKPVISNRHGFEKINQGVVFFCDENTPIFSIFPGKVVFSDWLNGYGLLLIIDHGWGYMSLYANNKVLTKHKGEFVQQSEQIATAGHTGTLKQNGLYFEIRQRGKAVNPLEWLA